MIEVKVTERSNMKRIELIGLSTNQAKYVKGGFISVYPNDELYELGYKCKAFLQGYDERHGFVLIEFWFPDTEVIEKFRSLLEKGINNIE